MAGKIRSTTTKETTNAQLSLFDKAKEACGAVVEEEVAEEELTEVKPGPFRWFTQCFLFLWSLLTFWRHEPLANRDDDVAVKARAADKKLKQAIIRLDTEGSSSDNDEAILEQLVAVNTALDVILSSTKMKSA